uniref:Uncharacterized protein n=1 Tax=Chromera velia CCMP2878 TaxID=1169474 RepID=A0A0G4FCG6_9ALVE|eukprot:Cvel_16310.t1-p1 / transcript=Cvel_16310.t1 / gene=Cvel_16310 / organism=Chromera_velia_CCMP2878 / gene_product=hypothetical protein / transcript_product=hypothetical protein / location=Cvel_scaffold1251:43929-44531(-) / protein_length=201 / sequence_SO=supercontig / SO=protein_coding / is_pseudo=false
MLFPDAHTAKGEGEMTDGERSLQERPQELPPSVRLVNIEWQRMEERLKQPEEGPPTEASKRKRHKNTNRWDNPILAATEGEVQSGRSGKRGRGGGRNGRGGTGRGGGRGGAHNHRDTAGEKEDEDTARNQGLLAAASSSSFPVAAAAVATNSEAAGKGSLPPNGLGPVARAMTEAERHAEQATRIQGQAAASSAPVSIPLR